jgi:hypothetical protein
VGLGSIAFCPYGITLQLSCIALAVGRIQRPLKRCEFFDAGRLCH